MYMHNMYVVVHVCAHCTALIVTTCQTMLTEDSFRIHFHTAVHVNSRMFHLSAVLHSPDTHPTLSLASGPVCMSVKAGLNDAAQGVLAQCREGDREWHFLSLRWHFLRLLERFLAY